MELHLRPGLSWCLCNRRAVFLDLPHDRYFCLPEERDTLFQDWARGDGSGSPEVAAQLADVIQFGSGLRAQTILQPATRDLAESKIRAQFRDTCGAALAQLRARRALRRKPIAALLTRPALKSCDTEAPPGRSGLERIAAAFRASSGWVEAADQCLPRALAARRMCNRHGLGAALVLGVRLTPFAAHAWVQAGDAVVVGDLEQVRLYTPILVVP
ncbi:hypothetical protein FHR20_000093 [Sphingomonas leidyi]|uniref:Microcin J25-processing protein McjB C-terminal domain-containing protein n=1 Tax=Sphingomonas leidyi TaxID=68569 RepID=A0A7X5ZTK4_9SPHN|nr:lasso peptide biosynthesis B2 protein [Sphingomonas leidyi]NIJ63162.1 hypothetical protein [Sphingomonas leidyi]